MKRVACVLLALGIALGTALEPAADAKPKTTTHDTLSAALQAETEKEELNMKKQVCTVLLAMMLTLNGCGGDTEPAVTDTTTTATTTTTVAAATTTTEDVAEVTTTDSTTATDAEITTTDTELQVTTTTSAPTTKAATTTKAPVTTTTTKPATTAAPVVQTTTSPTTAAPTTAAPTTAADTRPTVVDLYGNSIQLFPEDPWKYPYDVEACRKDCKEYIESLGIEWDESIGLENSTWAGNILTDAYSRWPEEATLKRDPDGSSVFGKIDFEAQSWKPDAMNVIWIPEPVGTEYGTSALDGNYAIYVVMR